MKVSQIIENGVLYIALDGRLEASNSSEVEEEIFKILDLEHNKTILDADKLNYISSAGLRIVLRLKKKEKKLKIINVSPDVYDIFEMTGFVEIVEIEKGYPRLSLDGCEFIAKGANGAVYRYNDETILKIYFGKNALPEIKKERENAKKAFVLGINTAIPYGIVKVGDNYGTLTELLNAKSMSQFIKEDVSCLEKMADYFVETLKNIHEIEVDEGVFANNLDEVKEWVEIIRPHLPKQQIDKITILVNQMPYSNKLMHGDLHTNNIMIQNNEAILIDMDTLSEGHPILEFGYIYNALIGYSEDDPYNVEGFLGFSLETAKQLYRLILEKYFKTKDEKYIQEIIDKARLIGHIRILRRSIQLNNSDSPSRIKNSKEQIGLLLDKVDCLYY